MHSLSIHFEGIVTASTFVSVTENQPFMARFAVVFLHVVLTTTLTLSADRFANAFPDKADKANSEILQAPLKLDAEEQLTSQISEEKESAQAAL